MIIRLIKNLILKYRRKKLYKALGASRYMKCPDDYYYNLKIKFTEEEEELMKKALRSSKNFVYADTDSIKFERR